MPSEAKVHTLKTWSRFFDRVKDGSKTFELRYDDRGFKLGDVVELVRCHDESPHGRHTGAQAGRLCKRITYVMHGGEFGLQDGWVCLGLGDVDDGRSHERIAEARLERNEEVATILRQRANTLTDDPSDGYEAVNSACARELLTIANAIQGDDTYEADSVPALNLEIANLRARVAELECPAEQSEVDSLRGQVEALHRQVADSKRDAERLYARLTKYEDV